MATRYVNIDRRTALLLPPDLRDWVPQDHLAHFVIEAVEYLDVSSARADEGETAGEQFPPGMLLELLIYSYATGTFSSRQIERLSYENVAVRFLCADTHPHANALFAFRRQNSELLAACFAQVLELAAGCGMLQVGRITVAIEGAKVVAHASRFPAVNYDHAGQMMRPVEQEIALLLRKAEEADATPLDDGLTVPAELLRRGERKALLDQARVGMEARASARFREEQAEHFASMAGRGAGEAAGNLPRGFRIETPEVTAGPREQAELTEKERRLIEAGSSETFVLADRRREAVAWESR